MFNPNIHIYTRICYAATHTVVVMGSTAHLSCNMTPPTISDRVYLVLWFKNNNPMPVYSYDAREFTKKRWSEDKQFGARASFRDTVSPAQLRIVKVEKGDEGSYMCRVDFRNSPTVTSMVELEVVEQASKPVVINDEGVEVMGSVGPYLLGEALILVCMAEGEPPPRVVWLMDGEVLDYQMDPGETGQQRRNTLVISPLDRTHAGTIMRCVAENNNVSQAPYTDIMLEMNMPVMDIRMVNLPSPLTAGSDHSVLCQVTGAHPPPQITWTITQPHGGTELLSGSTPSLSSRGNLSTSVLDLTISKEEHGKVLTCTAKVQPDLFPPVNISSQLTVHHPPTVRVVVQGDKDLARVVEGQSVQLECEVTARPQAQEYRWVKNGSIVSSERTLQFSPIMRENTGKYRCEAENSEGVGESSHVRVVVSYRPVCLSPTTTPHPSGFTPGVSLSCQVDSHPSPSDYRWLYNSSQGSFEIPNAKSLMSFMNYAVSDGGEQGEVLCWASNELGEQVDPCVFYVVPLGSPHPPRDCAVSEQTAAAVQVSCKHGFSGGMEQHFVLEVFEMVNGSQTLVASNWSRDPSVRVVGLTPNSSYILSIHAANARGESEAVYVGGQTASWLPQVISSPPDRLPVLYIIVAVLCSIMILSLILSITAACRHRLHSDKDSAVLSQDKPSTELVSQTRPLIPSATSGRLSTHTHHHTRKDPERKVSFRSCGCASRTETVLGIQRTVVRSYDIDKLRQRCSTCNHRGNTPYPPPLHSDTQDGWRSDCS